MDTFANTRLIDLSTKVIELESNLDSMTKNWEFQRNLVFSYLNKIANVRDHIMECYSYENKISDDLIAIAELLEIELTKHITGKMTIEVEFSADVPLNFDSGDIELLYEVSCYSIEADNFDYSEVNAEWTVEDEI